MAIENKGRLNEHVIGHRLTRRAALQAGAVSLVTTALAAHGLSFSADAQDASPAATAGSPSPAGDAAFPPEQQLAMEAIVATSMAQTSTPGALVGVWYPGRGTWLHDAGIGDLTTAAPVTIDDHIRIASITKTFTATVVLQLVDEGKLGLDDHLEQFVPGIPNGDRITLRQVLGMTAGIFDYVADPEFAAAYDRDPLLPFSPSQAVGIIRRHAPDFPPGAQVQYSNSNYMLLGSIIEQVTGQAAGAVITDRIITPLGLTSTSFPTTPEMPSPYTHGYEAAAVDDALRDVTRSNPDVPWTAGAIISTLADLRTWAKALADGTLLSPATQRERLTWGVIPGEVLDVRYGLGILEVNGLIGHNGGIAGYSSWMVHAPEEDATVVVVTNRGGSEGGTSDPIFLNLARLLFPERFPALAATPAPGTPAP